MKQTTAIVQARLGSTRLPGKALMDLGGKPVLVWVIDRLKLAGTVEQIVVATTEEAGDDRLVEFAEKAGCAVFRGSTEDVLDRYYRAAEAYDADPVVRITADCPFIDPQLVDLVVLNLVKGGYDCAGLSDYPDGLDTTAYRFEALKRAWREAKLPSEREHVGPYISNHPELFKLFEIKPAESMLEMRWTIDEERDLVFARELLKQAPPRSPLLMEDILEILEQNPQLEKINQDIVRNEGYLISLEKDRRLSE